MFWQQCHDVSVEILGGINNKYEMNILVLHCLVERVSIIRTSIFVTTQMFKNIITSIPGFLRDVKGA